MDDFTTRYSGVYEKSPWVAEQAMRNGVPSDPTATMREIVEAAPRARQLALLCAHPDLAGRLALAGDLTAESKAEQTGAGLDCCTQDELAEFTALNRQYTDRFGFPFILAVRGHNRASILAAFRRRIGNDPEAEFREALDQVHRIAALRIAELRGDIS